ncbi:uncharacterized protein LOC120413419 [Culex pipiens pallens]|uniref:uncharacterized protein LOC120413419 n=1 Tax=Culex pipiens pallens TaxID=42434 RepID=UPI0022AA8B9C|nr:uncharacterized protein LOC120413419 [Culex pipiens pallens]
MAEEGEEIFLTSSETSATESSGSESETESSDSTGESVKSSSPVMSIKKMNPKQIKRLTISPRFMRKLSEVYASKSQEQKKRCEKDDPAKKKSPIPDPPPPPPKPKPNSPKSDPPKPDPQKPESSKSKPSKDKKSKKKSKSKDDKGGAPDLDLDKPPNLDDVKPVDSEKLLPPGFNIKSASFDNVNFSNNPLFYNMNTSGRANKKTLPISQWPIKYSGTDNGIGLNLFLRRVEFFAHSERVTKSELFESAHLLLVGPAQDWFVSKWPTFRNEDWDFFIHALRHQYLPNNIDHYIKVRSFSMSQNKNETFSNFLVRMEQFFLCRTTPLAEEDKFDIIWHTMKWHYRDRLALIKRKGMSINELEDLCGRIDNCNEGLMNRLIQSFDNQNIHEIITEGPSTSYKPQEPHERGKNQQNQSQVVNQSRENSHVGQSTTRNNQTNQQNSNRYNQTNQNATRNSQFNQNQSNTGQSSSYNQNNYRNNQQQQQNYQNTNRNQSTQERGRTQEEFYPENGWRSLNREQILHYYKQPDGRICLNCRKFGHHFSTCYSRRNVFCCICGLPEFHYEECPFCEEKNRRREN